MDMNHDWKLLSETWQSQAAPGIDMDALRREVGKRGRYLRFMVGLELVTSVLFAAMCAVIVLMLDSDGFERILFSALGVFLVAYQAYVIWLRRRELNDTGLDADSLVDLEIRRSHTTLHYWRIGMWVSLALWMAIYFAFLFGMDQGWETRRIWSLMGGLVANVVIMPAMGLFALWRCRGVRERLARFRDLQDQLRAP